MSKENNINFYQFSINLEINCEVSVGDLTDPGIYGVECVKTNRIIILDAENTLLEMSEFFQKLEDGKIKNSNLFEDYKVYGKENFKFYVFDTNLEWEQSSKRYIEVMYYTDMYSGKMY